MMASTSIKRVSIKRQLQQFSVQDKLDAIQRVNEGESKASVARDIGVPESTLRGWCKSEEKLRCSSTELENESLVDQHGLSLCHNGSLDLGTKRVRHEAPSVLPVAPTTTKQEPELDEALWYWLRQQQQHVAGLSEQLCQQSQQVKSSTSSSAVAAAAAAIAATTNAMNTATDLNPTTGWFWRWYKRYGLATPDALTKQVKSLPTEAPLPLINRSSAPTTISTANSLLTTTNSLINLSRHAQHPQPAHAPSTSHTPHNNHSHVHVHALAPAHQAMPQPMAAAAAAPPEPDDPTDDEEDDPPLTAADAVAHGEKFLRWLDCCSDPSITALQILQFRYLLNNVRACAARRAKAAANRSDKS